MAISRTEFFGPCPVLSGVAHGQGVICTSLIDGALAGPILLFREAIEKCHFLYAAVRVIVLRSPRHPVFAECVAAFALAVANRRC